MCTTLPAPICGKPYGIMQIHKKQMKFSGVSETNWQQFFIYLNFNCTIA